VGRKGEEKKRRIFCLTNWKAARMKDQPHNGCKVGELLFQGHDVAVPSLSLKMFAVA